GTGLFSLPREHGSSAQGGHFLAHRGRAACLLREWERRAEGAGAGAGTAQEVAEVKEDDAEIILPQRKSAPQHYGAATYPRSKHKSGRLECPRWKTKT
ncbi:unnamed protein product, partial [Prorocentrum cordatum]